jgi:acyl-CoA thioesterase FadM
VDRSWQAEEAAGLANPEALPPAGEVIVRARTVWAFVDLTSGCPRRVPPGLREGFQIRAG